MHAKNTLNTARLALAALAISGGFSLAQSAFAVEALPQGYQLASAEKTSEGKCGEGKCGAASTTNKVSQSEGKCCLLYTSPSPRDRG